MIQSVSGKHSRVTSPDEKACEILALWIAHAVQMTKENVVKEPGITPLQASSVLSHVVTRAGSLCERLRCKLDVATGYAHLLPPTERRPRGNAEVTTIEARTRSPQ